MYTDSPTLSTEGGHEVMTFPIAVSVSKYHFFINGEFHWEIPDSRTETKKVKDKSEYATEPKKTTCQKAQESSDGDSTGQICIQYICLATDYNP